MTEFKCSQTEILLSRTEEPKAVIWAKVNRGAGQRGGWTVK